MNCSNCITKLNYANARKLLDLNWLYPIGLLPGVSHAWSCCQKVVIHPKAGQQSNCKTPMNLGDKVLNVDTHTQYGLLNSLCLTWLALLDQDRSFCLLIRPHPSIGAGCDWTKPNTVELLGQEHPPCKQKPNNIKQAILFPSQHTCKHRVVMSSISYLAYSKTLEIAVANSKTNEQIQLKNKTDSTFLE